ncbi:unnamed protein product [Kuraishia capsulata CBS 1993]|uniref:Major facilitator superfamily (MFS) profile domain-containing protein n=1 Tax=Kuraishia capsulata CBS 1993 TaxID=1382522 RepID=W6MQ41_9ASCO|nr:uncharacterized protein KUCA_T00003345001 [Kuraishia capsulata CBS 1993]CDK27367.1 unnamed protein product [Kuraishia capsulata CBS 1993]
MSDSHTLTSSSTDAYYSAEENYSEAEGAPSVNSADDEDAYAAEPETLSIHTLQNEHAATTGGGASAYHGLSLSRTLSSMTSRTSRSSVRPAGLSNDDVEETQDALIRTQTRQSILEVLSRRATETEARLESMSRRDSLFQKDIETGKNAEMESQKFEEDAGDGAENIPGSGIQAEAGGQEFLSLDPNLIAWNGIDDPDYPRNWNNGRKWKVTLLVAAYTFMSPLVSTIISPAVAKIGVEFHESNSTILALIVSIYILAWVFAPLFVAPLSEMYGRSIVLNVSVWALLVFSIGVSRTHTVAQICVLRFFSGAAGAAPLSSGAGVIGDLFDAKTRNAAMAVYAVGPSLAPALAPVISGFITENCGWRWVMYVSIIAVGIMAVLGLIFYEETYPPTLLRRKAAKLRKETGNPYLITIYDIASGETNTERFIFNIERPLKLLFTHPMVFGLGVFMAFCYGFMYLLLVTFPGVYEGSYGFSLGIAGLMYLPLSIGFLAGLLFWTKLIDHYYFKLTAANNGVPKPEYRLPILIFAGIGIPISLFWYGWSVEKKIHWIMSCIGSGLFGFSLTVVFQTIQNYLVDMNPRFAASAIGAATVFRSAFGFAFPLFADQMYAKLNYGWGNSLCGFIALLLGVPFPLFVLKYGERMRLWANHRMELEQAKRDVKHLERLKTQQAERAANLEKFLAEKNGTISSHEEKTESHEETEYKKADSIGGTQ